MVFSSQTDILLRIYNQKRIIAVTFFLIWKIIEIMPIFGSSLQIKRDKINCSTRLEEKCGMIKEGLIGKRIKELCWNLDMSYYWLAYKSAVPITTLMHIIDGSTKNPGVYTLMKICDGFGITLIEFFDTDDFRGIEHDSV